MRRGDRRLGRASARLLEWFDTRYRDFNATTLSTQSSGQSAWPVSQAVGDVVALDEETRKQCGPTEERYPFHPSLTEIFYPAYVTRSRGQLWIRSDAG